MATEFTQTFFNKVYECVNLNSESVLKRIFVESLAESVQENMRLNQDLNRHVGLF